MSVVFGYIGKDGVYLASDNRITDAEGNFVSDDDIKIEVVNNKTAVAFAGNYAAQNFFLKCYKERSGYQNWFVNDLASNIWAMCDAITKMDMDWAKAIANSIACFLVAGKTKDNEIKLFAVTLKQGHIDLKEVPMMLYQPADCDFNKCANILCKNIKQHFKDFPKCTIQEISKLSDLVSDSGNMWMYDIKMDESKFVVL
jgi:hypothetical protein